MATEGQRSRSGLPVPGGGGCHLSFVCIGISPSCFIRDTGWFSEDLHRVGLEAKQWRDGCKDASVLHWHRRLAADGRTGTTENTSNGSSQPHRQKERKCASTEAAQEGQKRKNIYVKILAPNSSKVT